MATLVQHVGFRQLTLKRARAKQDVADYFGVAMTGRQADLQHWLKISCLTNPPIFVSPRPVGTEAGSKYRIPWIGKEGGLAAAIAATLKVINHSGVVSKAPSFGIRVEERRYQSAFAELRSGSAFKPNLVGTPKHFLLL